MAKPARPAARVRRVRSLGDCCGERHNHFTLLRILLALSVALAHAWIVILGLERGDPFRIYDLSLSYMAVNGFFVLSGFFIAKSLDERRDLVVFAASRTLRLMPAVALLAVVALVAFGPLFTDMSYLDYFRTPDSFLYPLRILVFADTSSGPPGIFAANTLAGEFSAPLWTLRYEAIAYVGAAVLFALGLSSRRMPVLAAATLATAGYVVYLWVVGPEIYPAVSALARFAMSFLLGMAAWAWRDRLPLHGAGVLALVAGFLLLGVHPASEALATLALGYGLLWAGLRFAGPGRALTKIEDVSYGLYIWHFPLMQAYVHLRPAAQPVEVALLVIPLAIVVAWASWRFVERPALGFKPHVSEWRTRRARRALG